MGLDRDIENFKLPARSGKNRRDADGALRRLIWAYRRELALTILGVAVGYWLRQLSVVAAVPVSTALLGVIVWVRKPLGRWLRTGRIRRHWASAVTACGLDYPTRRHGAKVTGEVQRIPVGDKLRVRFGRGISSKTLDARRHELAAALHVDDVRVTKDRGDASRATVLLIRNDPFDDYVSDGRGREVIRPLPWPIRGASHVNLWDPLPIGVNENGDVVNVVLPDHNLLIGGEPGAGKSVAVNLICAAGALDPTVRLWLFDGKVLELGPWSGCAERYVGPDVKEALTAVQSLREVMDDRYRELQARGARKIQPDHDLPLYLVVVDELAFYLSTSNTKLKSQVREAFRDLVARGRAAGVIFVAATQKPDADTIPSALRDLIGYRLALRCNTWQHSDTILGAGRASAGTDASAIPGRQRGVGYLLAEGERPVRVRGFHLADGEVEAVASRGFANRAEHELAALAK